jgi:hypothetical protein
MSFARSTTRRLACAIVALCLALYVGLATGCGADSPASPSTQTLNGEWTFSVSASPACAAVLPAGFATAPRGGGRAVLTQMGERFSGQLYIFDGLAGTIQGSVIGERVQLDVALDGKNVGTLSPEHEPCRVIGSGSGSTDYKCFLSASLSGEFACPYSCGTAPHFLLLRRGGRGC